MYVLSHVRHQSALFTKQFIVRAYQARRHEYVEGGEKVEELAKGRGCNYRADRSEMLEMITTLI